MNLGGSMKTEELRYLQRLGELYPPLGRVPQKTFNLHSISIFQKATKLFLPDTQESSELFSQFFETVRGPWEKR